MSFPGCCSDQHAAAAAAVTQHTPGFHHHHHAAAAALPGCQHAHWLCLCSMLLYRFVDEYPCCSIMLWLWTMRTNYMLQAQGLMLMLHTLILQISKCGKCFKCDLCIFKCTCPCIDPPADMHLCRRVLGRQICRVHMCPGHSVPPTCVGYTDTCSLISHLWHFRTSTIKKNKEQMCSLVDSNIIE